MVLTNQMRFFANSPVDCSKLRVSMAGPRERPLGVTILAAVCICGGPMFVLAGLVWLIVTRNILLFFVPFGAIPLVMGIVMGLLWGSLLLATGIGLLRVKNWSRWSLIVLIGY